MSTPDKYDDAVKYLTANPSEIRTAWGMGTDGVHAPGWELFGYAAKDPLDSNCGCLTQIREGAENAETGSLTVRIRADKRIPIGPQDLEVKHLEVFAEWQRIIDVELER